MYMANAYFFRVDPFQSFSTVVGFDPHARAQMRRAFYAATPNVVVLSPIRSTLSLLDILAASQQAIPFQRGLDTYNLRERIERHEKERAAKFFDPANLERVGRRERQPQFVAVLKEMVRNPTAYNEQQKKQMLQFVANAYNDAIGAPRLNIHLFDGMEYQMGGYRAGRYSLRVNRNNSAFHYDFAELINVVVHECTHNAQYNPNRYSDPVLSRIYRANFAAYHKSENGYQTYRWQPIEIGAFTAGETAKRLVTDLAYANDNRPRGPIHGNRPVWGYNAA